MKIIKSDVYKFLKRNTTNYDIIFADPPYSFEDVSYEKIIELIIEKEILNEGGLIIIEHSKKTNLKNIQNHIETKSEHSKINSLKELKNYKETRIYGGCCFSFFKI